MVSFEAKLSRNTKGRPSIFIFGWKVPPWAYQCYRVVGVFCFGAACSQLITDIGKYSIGRLRPHFFDICQPDVDCSDASNNFLYIDYEEYTCKGTDAKLLRESR